MKRKLFLFLVGLLLLGPSAQGMIAEVGPHNMTSDSAPSPFVASATSEIWGNAYQAFNGALTAVTGYGWATRYPPQSITIDLGSSQKFSAYAIEHGSTFGSGSWAKTWVLSGSLDNVHWVTLDSQTGQSTWQNGEIRYFNLSGGPVSYRYIQLTINDTGDGTYITIGQLFFYSSPLLLMEIGPHNMTADNAPSPYVASATDEYDTPYQAWKSFDNNINDEWRGYVLPCYLKIDLGAPATCSGYAFYVPWGAYWGESAPKSWTFQGSNDNSTWVTLDTQTNITLLIGNMPIFYFNSVKYRYYQLSITANQGGPFTEVGEMYLYQGTAAPPASTGDTGDTLWFGQP